MKIIDRITSFFYGWAKFQLRNQLKSVEQTHRVCLMNGDFPHFYSLGELYIKHPRPTYKILEIEKYEPVDEGYEKGGRLIPIVYDNKKCKIHVSGEYEWVTEKEIEVRYFAIYNINDGAVIFMKDMGKNSTNMVYIGFDKTNLLLEIT